MSTLNILSLNTIGVVDNKTYIPLDYSIDDLFSYFEDLKLQSA